jgi:AraC-like DNA-binding protein
MFIKVFNPKPSLITFIRKYQVIRWTFQDGSQLPPKFLAPRPEHSLAFYIRDSQYFNFLDSPKIIEYPKSIICGVHDKTILRDCGQDFWAIKVIFQPCGLYRLTGIPARELVSNFYDAEAVFGKEVRLLYERLNSTNDLQEMVNHIEFYLEKVVTRKLKYEHPLDTVTTIMLEQKNTPNLDLLAKQSALSIRQFIRKFEERIGISPKMYDRIIRFDKAYRLKNNNPEWDWLTIAMESGYYDYQHLAKDYKDFTNTTPVKYYEIDKKAPERNFGLHFG